MNATKGAMALLAAILLLPLGAAELTFNTPTDAASIAPEGSTTVDLTASLSCDEFLDPSTATGGGSQTRTADLTYPEGLSGPATLTFTFAGDACSADPTGSVQSDSQSATIAAASNAPGKEALSVNITNGDTADAITVEVDYKPGYTLDVHQEFPVTVNKDENGEWIPVTFTADILLTANANTMVMMQVTDRAEFGSMSGLFSNSPHIFRDLTADELTNGLTKEVTFTYTPTAEGWAEDTIASVTWSHWLEDGNAKTADQPLEWTFINGEFEEEKGAPGFSPALLGLALVGAGMVAARRRN